MSFTGRSSERHCLFFSALPVWKGPEFAATDARTGYLSVPLPDQSTQPFRLLNSKPVPAEVGERFDVAVWSAQGAGGRLTGPDEGQPLRDWLIKREPSVFAIPEASVPALKFRKSQDYLSTFKNFAQGLGYVAYWTHHWSGQARGGVAILVKAGIEVQEVVRGLDLDERPQFEGRVLALRMQGFWIAALYMPRRDDVYEHLLEPGWNDTPNL